MHLFFEYYTYTYTHMYTQRGHSSHIPSMCMGVVWEIYYRPHPWRKLSFPSPMAINRHSSSGRDATSWALLHPCSTPAWFAFGQFIKCISHSALQSQSLKVFELWRGSRSWHQRHMQQGALFRPYMPHLLKHPPADSWEVSSQFQNPLSSCLYASGFGPHWPGSMRWFTLRM